jgi:DNA-binding transcriptional ArsR family regulator
MRGTYLRIWWCEMGIDRDMDFRALAHPVRRELLCLLHERDDTVVSGDRLSERLADRVEGSTQEEIHLSLYHIHLPHLDNTGLIEYDSRSNTVRYEEPEWLSTAIENGLLRDT